ncbi:MAG: AAA family ATPase, partial [Patescibacteria group bacterium]
EKAHPEVFNVLLQVLDNGRLTDSKGRTVNFKNTVIIMTSNIGAQYIERMQKIGFTSPDATTTDDYIGVKDKVLSNLKDHFRPEFLNRLDDVIVFDVLSPQAVEEIVRIQVELVKERLKGKEITLEISKDVLFYLAKEGYNPQYGARPLKRIIQNKILTPVAGMIISQSVLKGGVINVDIKNGEFIFDVKKGRRNGTFFEKREMEQVLN